MARPDAFTRSLSFSTIFFFEAAFTNASLNSSSFNTSSARSVKYRKMDPSTPASSFSKLFGFSLGNASQRATMSCGNRKSAAKKTQTA